MLITVKREFPVSIQTFGRDYAKNGLFDLFRLRILRIMGAQSRSILTDAGGIRKKERRPVMGTENRKMGGIYEAALSLARLWGIRETLEGVGDISQQEVSRIVTAWAEEFTASGQSDLAAFFAAKAQTVKAKGTRAAEGNGAPGGEPVDDRLLGRLYDRMAYWEDDAKLLDEEYDGIVEELLAPLRETMEEAEVNRISDTIYRAAYQARKNGFMVGARFTARLLFELSEYC